MPELLNMYRERSGDPGFWAEPVNALTNASFLGAAIAAYQLARRRGGLTAGTWALILLAMSIGIGSFLFHTCASHWTMWLDIIPIALFQCVFLWLAGRSMLQLSVPLTVIQIAAVIGASFAAMPIRQPLNGSLFYLPALIAIFGIGVSVCFQRRTEPYLLLMAAAVFALAIVARSVDWQVSWSLGTHFLWHLLNGLVLYLAMRAWILHESQGRFPPDAETG